MSLPHAGIQHCGECLKNVRFRSKDMVSTCSPWRRSQAVTLSGDGFTGEPSITAGLEDNASVTVVRQ
jgi:hypothetical protein